MFFLFFRLTFADTIGRDIDGDGFPDIPLRYELDNSESVVQVK